MSVIEFHIWPEDNPVGEANKLGVITDEDVVEGEGGPAIWYEPSLHGLGGSAGFSISRHSPLATSAIIREDNFVRVKVPEISAGYLPFGWYMKSGEFHLIDSDEAGGENITIEGPGLLHKLATGSLYHSSTVSDQPARGSADRDGLWWWLNEPYGASLTRLFEEGRHSPYPDPAEVGSPLEFFDITFSRTADSSSVAWPNIDAEFQVAIGTDLMAAADLLRESGNLYIVGDASDVDALTVHCYQTYGANLTGAFGAGTVRFEKAVNIATELVRRSEAGLRINKLLVRDSDGNYSTETLPGFTAGDVERWGFWDASQTNDDTLLNAIGANVLAAAQTSVEPLGFEQPPGKDPTNGLYLPGLHYKQGDTVTLHTGTDPEEYDEAPQLVVAYKVSVREGTTDDTSVRAQRSLKIEPQLNYYAPRYGSSNLGTGPTSAPGCRCIQPCSALTPGTESLFRFYASSASGAASPAIHSGWDADSFGSSLNQIKTTPDGTYPSTGTGSTSSAAGDADGRNVLYWAGMSSANIGSSLAAVLATGGATVRGQFPARGRYGIGITEANQQMMGNIALRVTQGATTTVRGTAYVPHTVGSMAGVNRWVPQSAHLNRRFPAATASDVLAAVPGTVSTDRLVLELGSRNFTLTTSGGAILLTSDDAADLPEDETSGIGPNGWIEIRAISAPTGEGHHPDLVGTDKDYARCDHSHHILANRDPSSADDITQGYPTKTLWTNTETHQSFILVDEDTGDWQPFATAGEHTHDADDIAGLPTEGGGSLPHSHPDLSIEPFEVNADDGGWIWFTDPRAIQYNGWTYFATVSGDDGDVAVEAYENATGTRTRTVLAAAFEDDDHAGPALLIRESDHKLMAFYCEHLGSQMFLRISTTSLDTDPDLSDGFAAAASLDASIGATNYTYPNPVQLTGETNDPIYLIYRDHPGGDPEVWYSKSTDGGATWAAGVKVYDETGLTSYWKVGTNGVDRIDFALTDGSPFVETDISLYHFYYEGGAWFKTDGTDITADLPFVGADLQLVYDGTGAEDPSWVWDCALGPDGNPVIAFVTFPSDSDHRYQYARWTGSEWVVSSIVAAGGGLAVGSEYFSGGVTLDHAEPSVVWASINSGSVWEIHRLTTPDGGTTWVDDPITDDGAKNFRPVVPRNSAPELQVLWMRGTYGSLTVWDTATWGAGSSAASHPDLATHDALGLATDAELAAHAADPDAHHAADSGGVGQILISDTPSTPLIFADLIQNEAQDDLVYGDP